MRSVNLVIHPSPCYPKAESQASKNLIPEIEPQQYIYLILLKSVSITDDEMNNCIKTKTGNEYAGKTDKTQTGSTCVNWTNSTDSSLAATFPGQLTFYQLTQGRCGCCLYCDHMTKCFVSECIQAAMYSYDLPQSGSKDVHLQMDDTFRDEAFCHNTGNDRTCHVFTSYHELNRTTPNL